MSQLFLLSGCIFAGTVLLLVAQLVWAETKQAATAIQDRSSYSPTSPSSLAKERRQRGALMAQQQTEITQVTNVQLQQTDRGLEVILETVDGKQLQVFPTSFSKTYVANIPNAQLAQGKSFRQENPVAGIASIAVTQQEINNIRVTVTGKGDLPIVAVNKGDRALTLTLPEALAKLNKGLGFGAGIFYVDSRAGDLDNSREIPDYTRIDAAFYYEKDNFKAALNFKNLFDIKYFEGVQYRESIFPGIPFTVLGTVSWEF